MTHRNLFTTTLAAAVLALSATSLWAQTTVKVDDAWVRGTVAGQKVTLPGLVDRRATTQELCAEWGRTGHFSEHILDAKK